MKHIHKENNKTYHVILRDVKLKPIKVNPLKKRMQKGWYDAVMYTREADHGNETLFVRSKGEFNQKFQKQ